MRGSLNHVVTTSVGANGATRDAAVVVLAAGASSHVASDAAVVVVAVGCAGHGVVVVKTVVVVSVHAVVVEAVGVANTVGAEAVGVTVGVVAVGVTNAIAVVSVGNTVMVMALLHTLGSHGTTSGSGSLASPATLAGEDGMLEAATMASAVHERRAAVQGDVVVAEVPDGSVHHAVAGEGKDGTNGGTSKDIIPVVVLVNSESTTNENRTEDGGVDGDELPEGGVVVGEDLELRVEVQVQEDEASKSSSGVTTRHRLERIINLRLVTRANLRTEVQVLEPITRSLGRLDQRRIRLADVEEVRAETTNEPLDKDLEDGGADEGVEQTNGGVVDVPEGADADLHDEEDDNGDEDGEHGGGPDGDDFLAEGVGELGVDDLAVGEGDGEGARGSRVGKVDLQESSMSASGIPSFQQKDVVQGGTYTKTNGAEDGHSDDIKSSALQPLAKRRPPFHAVRGSSVFLASKRTTTTTIASTSLES